MYYSRNVLVGFVGGRAGISRGGRVAAALLGAALLGVGMPAAAVDKTYQFTGSGSWNNSFSWTPFGIPTTIDRAFINTNDIVTINGDTAGVNDLFISNSGELRTNGFLLLVDANNAETDISGAGSVLTVTPRTAGGRAFDTDSLDINSGGLLDMAGGRADVDVDLDINSGGTLEGDGLVRIFGGQANKLTNSGTINATGGTLTLDASGGGTIDLDGAGGGQLVATQGTSILVIDGDLGTDDFSGTMTIGAGNQISFVQPWATDTGTINFNAAHGSGIGRIFGAAITHGGTTNVNSGTGIIGAPIVFESTSTVNVAAGATFDHNTIATYQGGTFTGGAGSLFRPGAMTVNNATTFDFVDGTVDLDSLTNSPVTLNANLTVNAASLDDLGDGYGGTMTIANAAQLRVNVTGGGSWQLVNTITYNGGATPPTTAFLAGSRLVIANGATLNVNGEGATLAPLDIAGTININTAGQALGLFGGFLGSTAVHNMTGGDIGGPGQLEVPSSSRLIGFGRIFADIVTSGSPVLGAGDVLADNGLLGIHSSILSANLVGTNSSTGSLRLYQPLDTANVTALELNGGVVFGAATINNNGIIRGHGSITALINNNTEIIAQGDILDLNNPNHNLDGTGNGVLRVSGGGNMRLINYDTTDPFGGDLIIENSGTFSAPGPELLFQSNGDLIFDGGTYVTNTNHSFNGRITVNDDSTLHTILGAVFTLNNGTTHTFNDILNVEGTLRVLNGTNLLNAGGGTLRINSNGLLRADANASIEPLLLNAGEVRIADSATGTLNLINFQQTASGDLGIDLAGVIPGNFDRLTMQGNAVLAGTLDVSLVGGFTPILGNSFTIIQTVAGNVAGTFATLDLPELDYGEIWLVDYNLTSVVLSVVEGLVGDYDGNGLVSQSDLDLVLLNWGDATPPVPEGWISDFPAGTISQNELDRVLLNWGNGTPPSVSAVPEPTSALLMALSGLLVATRRHSAA